MTPLFWNVRGINTKRKCRMVSDTYRNAAFETVCFLETKLTNPLLSALNKLGSRFDFVVKNAVGALGSIMIGVDRNCFEIMESRDGEFTLSVVTRRRKDGWT